MDTQGTRRTVAAPRLTATLGLLLAVGVLAQGLTAGAFLQGDHQWHAWHEALGNALVLPPLISLVVALALLRRQADMPSVLATRIILLVLAVIAIGAGHAGRSLLVVHIPAAIAVVGIAVRQATGFARISDLTAANRHEADTRVPNSVHSARRGAAVNRKRCQRWSNP